MKDARPAPTPDPAIAAAAARQTQLAEEWLGFTKEQFRVSQQRQAELDALTKEVSGMQLDLAKEQVDQARADRARYNEKFIPLEDQLVKEAAEAGTTEKQAAAAAEARADVLAAADAARGTAERQAMAVGIRPDSGRFEGIRRSTELGTTLAVSDAENRARARERDRAVGLRADAINLGRGLPASAAGATSAAAGLGGSAVGLRATADQQANQLPGIMQAGYTGAMSGVGAATGIRQNQHATDVGIWRTQLDLDNQEAAGLGKFAGNLLGLGLSKVPGLGMAASILSDERVKERKRPVPEGDALAAVKTMPVERWKYRDGVADGGEHVGPYAQDFAEATGSGDGRSIPVQDAVGLALKAVQDLDAKVERLSAVVVGLGRTAPRDAVNDNGATAPRRAIGA